MSGGSRDYFYSRLIREATLKDAEDINELVMDLATVYQAEEWYESGDTDEKDYTKALNFFRKKWIKPETRKKVETRILEGAIKRAQKVLKELK
jgi:hypothetical protein